jgi:hypothetical protein
VASWTIKHLPARTSLPAAKRKEKREKNFKLEKNNAFNGSTHYHCDKLIWD